MDAKIHPLSLPFRSRGSFEKTLEDTPIFCSGHKIEK